MYFIIQRSILWQGIVEIVKSTHNYQSSAIDLNTMFSVRHTRWRSKQHFRFFFGLIVRTKEMDAVENLSKNTCMSLSGHLYIIGLYWCKDLQHIHHSLNVQGQHPVKSIFFFFWVFFSKVSEFLLFSDVKSIKLWAQPSGDVYCPLRGLKNRCCLKEMQHVKVATKEWGDQIC